MRCGADDIRSFEESRVPFCQTQSQMLVTIFMLAVFVATKKIYDKFRREFAKLTVVVIGAGPVGLSSALVAAKTGRVSKIILFEETSRSELTNRSHQIAFDTKSVSFLRRHGVDFDNLEGCWDNLCFFTRIGVYLDYILSVLYRIEIPVDIRLNEKFSKDIRQEVDILPGRVLVITCDGTNGCSSRILGMSDDSIQINCGAYGAMACLQREDQRVLLPKPEKRAHNLKFDLTAYGAYMEDRENDPGFSLKIFGNTRNRYIALAITKCETALVKALRTILDRSLMRNLFTKCFNTYKTSEEKAVSDSYVLNHMQFSPRLSEIKLSQKCETVAYFDDCDMFVITEGEAARNYNFHTGMDLNVCLRGLACLSNFIDMITWAETEHAVLNALLYKMKHDDKICREFSKYGVREYLLS